jgi:galactokinase
MYLSSAPARVCLYGEHQDYLGLKVIPAAIDLRLDISSNNVDNNFITVRSVDRNDFAKISLEISSLSSNNKDFQNYLESGVLALKKKFKNIILPSLSVEIQSDIPIASGLSSSAALLVSWVKHLDGILNLELDEREIAETAYDAEHNILGIPCGKMDQYSSSFGSIISLTCSEPPLLSILPDPQLSLLVVDSNTPKRTSEVHGKKVSEIKKVVSELENITNCKLRDISIEEIEKVEHRISKENFKILEGVISIKTDTETAEDEFLKPSPDLEKLGKLLTSQHESLKQNIGVSLPILDKIVMKGLNKGALGGKLTGAGLGGSVVLLFESKKQVIKRELEKELGLQSWFVNIDKGATFKTS